MISTMSRSCGSCDENFKRNEASIGCNSCKKRFHYECSKLPEDEADALAKNKSKLKWFCIFCEQEVTEILTNLQKFRKVSVEISKMKEEMEEKLKNMDRRITVCESREPVGLGASEIREEITKQTEQEKKEEKLIELKKNNIVYFGVPESNNDSVEVRMKHDYDLVSEAHDENIINHDQIETMFRVGKKGTATRPLVVKFKSNEQKQRALKNSGDLKINYQNEIKTIYASIDRTEKQRNEHRKLVEMLKQRKQNGETNIGIRDGSIVQIFRREAAARTVTWASLFTS